IDSSQTTALVTNALGMAVGERNPGVGSIIHSDRGAQFTSWAFSHKVKGAGLAPSMGSARSAHDNAMMESFWARMQVELLNRKRWKTRIELATAIHDYIELFHNTKRRHSALNMLTPVEFETQHQSNQLAA
ncbi:MAG: transposase, partial [Solirubrobacterales bacterium]|nr:transposase [Solirubrobacterales bacterium]